MKTSVILSRALFVLFAVLCLTAAPFQGAAQENEPDESAAIMEMIASHDIDLSCFAEITSLKGNSGSIPMKMLLDPDTTM